jgi:hypothetical protein
VVGVLHLAHPPKLLHPEGNQGATFQGVLFWGSPSFKASKEQYFLRIVVGILCLSLAGRSDGGLPCLSFLRLGRDESGSPCLLRGSNPCAFLGTGFSITISSILFG